MFNRTMAAYRSGLRQLGRLPKSCIRCYLTLFLISASLLFGGAVFAEQVPQHVAGCQTGQFIDAKEAWGGFTSNEEATEFAKRKFLALGADAFVSWLSCQGFDVRVSPGRGAITNINASFMPRSKEQGLWVPSGVYYWLMPPGYHYIEAHVENGRLLNITATAMSE